MEVQNLEHSQSSTNQTKKKTDHSNSGEKTAFCKNGLSQISIKSDIFSPAPQIRNHARIFQNEPIDRVKAFLTEMPILEEFG